jgi:hypothetical protein
MNICLDAKALLKLRVIEKEKNGNYVLEFSRGTGEKHIYTYIYIYSIHIYVYKGINYNELAYSLMQSAGQRPRDFNLKAVSWRPKESVFSV